MTTIRWSRRSWLPGGEGSIADRVTNTGDSTADAHTWPDSNGLPPSPKLDRALWAGDRLGQAGRIVSQRSVGLHQDSVADRLSNTLNSTARGGVLVACPTNKEASLQQGLHRVPQIELLTTCEERAGFLVAVVCRAGHACAEQADTAD